MLRHSHIAAILLSTAMTSNLSHATDINFEIQGIKKAEGKLYIQLFKGEEDYKQGKAYSSTW